MVYKVGERTVEATHTTPDPVRLNAMMREMADEGCEYCFMECSSHAIVQERTRGLHFAGGIFSNITHDHLDYTNLRRIHPRQETLLLTRLKRGLRADQRRRPKRPRDGAEHRRGLSTYSLRLDGRLPLQDRRNAPDGMLPRIDGQEVGRAGGPLQRLQPAGRIRRGVLLGFDRGETAAHGEMLHPVSGRF